MSLYTVIHGDGADEMRKLAASDGWDRTTAVVCADPPWPDCEDIPIHGARDAVGVWRRAAAAIPAVADRLVLVLGRNVDHREMIHAVPRSMKALTVVTLRQIPPGYRGPLLGGSLAYVFGPARLRRRQAQLPGEIISNHPKAADRAGLKHPCPLSIQHATGLVWHYCAKAKVVIDPFAGSCGFGAAATRIGQASVNIDSDEQWCREGEARMKLAAAQLHVLPLAVLEQTDLEVVR